MALAVCCFVELPGCAISVRLCLLLCMLFCSFVCVCVCAARSVVFFFGHVFLRLLFAFSVAACFRRCACFVWLCWFLRLLSRSADVLPREVILHFN